MDIKTVLFDWGGVLIEDPAPGIIDFVKKELNLDVPIEVHFPDVALEAFQKGIITEREFWDEIGTAFNQTIDSGKSGLWRRAFESVYQEKSGVFGWIEMLRSKSIKTSVLSNTEKPLVEMLQSKGYDCFDDRFFSCECGLIKPDPVIFQFALKKMGRAAGEVLFIDDKEVNVKAAREVGLHAHCFRTLGPLLELAAKLDLPY